MGQISATVAQGDDAKFEALFESARAEVWRYASSRLGRMDADDVVADVFLAAHKALCDGQEVTVGWLMRVARNKVIDRWRNSSRRTKLVSRLAFAPSAQRPPSSTEALESFSEEVHEALDAISHRHRDLLAKHYLQGMAIAQIADASGCSYSATESAMARARRAFRQNYVAT